MGEPSTCATLNTVVACAETGRLGVVARSWRVHTVAGQIAVEQHCRPTLVTAAPRLKQPSRAVGGPASIGV